MTTVRVSEIRQFAFCPRVIWHRVVMGQPTRETPKMQMGRDTETALVRLERRRTLRQYGLDRADRRFSVFLESERLGMRGVCDLVLEVPSTSPTAKVAEQDPGESVAAASVLAHPVEVKTTRGGVGRHHVLQLTAYAMLLEEYGRGPVNLGFVLVLPEDRVHAVPTGPGERAEVLRIVAAIRGMFEQQRFPEPTRHRSFCPDCEYLNFCGDVL
jgi:CRISPR-associated exonuclease Cas4